MGPAPGRLELLDHIALTIQLLHVMLHDVYMRVLYVVCYSMLYEMMCCVLHITCDYIACHLVYDAYVRPHALHAR